MADVNVADDLSDKRGLVDKLWWVLNAILRFAAVALVVFAFLIGLLLLSQRYQADSALAGGAQGLQALAASGGGVGTSAATDEAQIEAARAARDARSAWDRQAALEAEQTARLAGYAAHLQGLAQRAGCDATTIDMALACAPGANTDATLRTEFEQTSARYREQHAELLETRAAITPLIGTYQTQALLPGASLQGALPAIEARDNLLNALPACLRGPALSFFQLPLLVNSVIVALLGGMFGASMVLLILLAFPSYAPLTFGGGKYFFLRMFTGGFVAVMVFVAIQSGVNLASLGDLQSAATSIQAFDPPKLALLGVFAGAFSEQIAGAVKGYVDRAFSAFGGAVSGGAPASGVSDEPPEGGPRPAL